MEKVEEFKGFDVVVEPSTTVAFASIIAISSGKYSLDSLNLHLNVAEVITQKLMNLPVGISHLVRQVHGGQGKVLQQQSRSKHDVRQRTVSENRLFEKAAQAVHKRSVIGQRLPEAVGRPAAIPSIVGQVSVIGVEKSLEGVAGARKTSEKCLGLNDRFVDYIRSVTFLKRTLY